MADPRQQTSFVVGASLLVLLCTVILVWAPKAQLVSSLPAPSSAGAHYQAFVIFRDADCEGNLSFARIFERPRYKDSFQLTGILLDAEPDDPDVRSKLKRSGVTMDLVRANRSLRRAVAHLALEPGPLLIILNEAGALRMVGVTPRSPSETRQFIALLNSFTAAES